MQFALRERQRLGTLLALWAMLTMLCAIAGPFGTLDALGVIARATYWGAVVAGSILGGICVSRLSAKNPRQRLLFWMLFAALLTGLVLLLNALVFGQAGAGGSVVYLFFIIAASVVVVNGLLFLAGKTDRRTVAPGEPVEDGAARFLRRLPFEKRGPLIRIEAQDH